MSTVSSLVTLALKDAGVVGNGQIPSDDDMDTGLTTLNQMIALWRTSNLEVYCQKTLILPVTTNAVTYSIGPGGDLDTDRPTAISGATWRVASGGISIDYVLSRLDNLTDWERVTLKAINAWPSLFLYEPTFPLGTLYVWPQPSGGEFHLTVKNPFPVYVSVGDDISLPPEYDLPIRSNLSVLLGPAFSTPIRPDLKSIADSSLRALKRSNTRISPLQMPAGIPTNPSAGRLNIISNQNS